MLTVEDGTIVADADTYADIAAVTTYATRYGFTFSGLELAQEQAILRAMIFIEAFEPYLAGQRVSAAQELSWPRAYVPSRFPGTYLADDEIPSGVINALAEAAIIELATPGILTQTLDEADQNVLRTRRKLGPLETETEYAGGTGVAQKTYSRILAFLRPYLKGGQTNAAFSIRAH